MTVTKEIQKLEKAFDLFNRTFYDGRLPRPVIQFYADMKQRMNGFITVNKVWVGKDEERTYELTICANVADRNIVDLYGTLLHEMAHLYDMENGIKDVSNNGYYHNKFFAETAEAHGLEVRKEGRYGWCRTTPKEWTRAFIEKELAEDAMGMKYEIPPKRKSRTSNTYKHVCPVCGAIARTTKPSVRLVCMDCEVPMEIVE